MRIVSFLPAGSEIAWALGGGGDLVGRSHECDYPAEVTRLPVVSRPALHLDGMTPEAVDRAVAGRLQSGQSLYQVDERLLAELAPDVVLTQDLCQVCAPSGHELSRALRELTHPPRVLWLSPLNLAGIDQNILEVGEAIGRMPEARALLERNRDRIAAVERALAGVPRRRVAFLEWLDPIFSAGHWVPEMIALAGGHDRLGVAGGDSVRVPWTAVQAGAPEIVLAAPCGFGLSRAIELARALPRLPDAQLYAVDANAYFARPGPRAAEAVELLAHLFHPGQFPWPHPGQPWAAV